MSGRNRLIDSAAYSYMLETVHRDDEHLATLREETAKLPEGSMQISPDQGQLMGLLCRAIGAERAIEVGVFTGYSALCVARALPANGTLVACDVSVEYTSVARRAWQRAGVADRIDLRIGPAADTLDSMLDSGEAGTYDFAFVDADKANYPIYYERCLELLRPGGLLLVDNALWGGRVADPAESSASTRAIRTVNERAGSDERVEVALLPVGDGLLIVLKR